MFPPSCAIPCQSAAPCCETIANVAASSSQRLRVPSSIAASSAPTPAATAIGIRSIRLLGARGLLDNRLLPSVGSMSTPGRFTGGKLASGTDQRLDADQRLERIIPAPTVSLVDSSIRMKLPVVRLRA